MIQKWFECWVVHRAFSALIMYHDVYCRNTTSDKSKKVIEVLDIIRGDIHE